MNESVIITVDSFIHFTTFSFQLAI